MSTVTSADAARDALPGTGVIRDNGFTPPRWLANGHAQTLWAGLVRRRAPVPLTPETLELPDGDDLQLFHGPPVRGPVVIVLHGLGGCARSPYVLGLLAALRDRGMQGVVMQFRGAGEHLNRRPRFFHAGAIDDLESTVERVRRAFPARPIAVVGFSMGGIVTLNWLGARGDRTGVDHAITVSTPLHLARCADHLDSGVRRVYDRHLVRGLLRLVRRKQAQQDLGLPAGGLRGIRSLRDFDEHVTSPLHGFRGADDYYRRCSPMRRLANVRVPTRMIQALDDPFVPPDSLPGRSELPASVSLELSGGGGHVGFVTGASPLHPGYWLDTTIPDMLWQGLEGGGLNARRPPDGGLLDPAG
ncbi:hydrolase [Aquisalimonas lutea]|uniref:hydrolase n=1 Tax=Aquisalimonas lutea TaxID=1327750 RepID=UPI0025B4A23B|nr:hydrolase [Aquisalimonas lutea]MDN3517620.1 hydrolase [Aquisalimonas lutea]